MLKAFEITTRTSRATFTGIRFAETAEEARTRFERVMAEDAYYNRHELVSVVETADPREA